MGMMDTLKRGLREVVSPGSTLTPAAKAAEKKPPISNPLPTSKAAEAGDLDTGAAAIKENIRRKKAETDAALGNK